jgi:hypothetical protein
VTGLLSAALGAATGIASWLVLREISGVDEPWDASWFWPAMLALSFVFGFIVARGPFWLGAGIAAGQLLTMLLVGDDSSPFVVLAFVFAVVLAGMWGLAAWGGLGVRRYFAKPS